MCKQQCTMPSKGNRNSNVAWELLVESDSLIDRLGVTSGCM
jgi:hypothetical protein